MKYFLNKSRFFHDFRTKAYDLFTGVEAGFSIIELAVVLLVVGLLLGLTLPLFHLHEERMKMIKTQDHQRLIHKALKVYQQSHPLMILPCPGNPWATIDSWGTADCSTHNQEGIVPFRTLGLPEKIAKDGYNRYLTYVVEHNLTRPMDDFDSVKGGHIEVLDESGINVLDSENTQNFITFVLISHGLTGHGSYLRGGGRVRHLLEADLVKYTNANGFPQYQCGGEDLVYWVSQMQFRGPS